jgi:hypothetical protein
MYNTMLLSLAMAAELDEATPLTPLTSLTPQKIKI